MMPALNLPVVAQISAERLLNCVAEGILIALFAGLLLRLIARRNSGTRFAVWFAALVAIAVAPFVTVPGSHSLTSPVAAALTIPGEWALYLFTAWAAVAAGGLLRVAFGLTHLYAIRRCCAPLDVATLDPLLKHTLGEFRAVRPVEFSISEEVRVPTAIGFFRPAVILPLWTVQELSTSELHTILLHELAHLGRWDDWTNLAQKVLRALFFFHPAVWWVENRLSLEREMACDDIVLAHTENPRAYAECLVSLAEKNLLRRGVALAQAAVGRMRQTSQRIQQILDARRPRAVQVWKPAPWVVGAFSAICLVSTAHAPKLVAFHNGESASVAQSAVQVMPAKLDTSPSPAPQIVAAQYVEPTRTATPLALRPHRTSAKARGAMTRPQHQQAIELAGPKVVQTKSPAVADQPVVSQRAVFVIMEGERVGWTRPIVWHFAVWQITFVPGGKNQQTPPETFSKNI